MVEAQVSQPLPHLNTGAVRTARSDPASPEVAVSDADRERDPHLPVWILASLVLFALFIAAIVWGTDRATSAAKTTHRPPGEGDIQETLRYINADGSLAEFNEETMKLVEKDPSKALSKLLGRDSLDSGGVDKPGSQAERANRTSSAEMVSVPAGEFSFGCNKAVDRECKDNEQPLRRFTLPTFLIDRTEVTVAAYRACVQAGKCSAPRMGGSCNWNSGRDDHPINCVTWGQARAYCQWQGKRLPTEYEWEKAARGAEGRLYAWGSEAVSSGRYANIAGTADGWKATAPVGTYPAGRSPYGADDMIGNVWEWCASVDDPRPGEPLRGGSWADEPRYVRASYRGRDEQGAKGEDYGFRCVR
jgi:formylglycine-generating enzyme required for sulfatase activity